MWPGPQAFIHEEAEYYQRLMHTPTLATPWNDWLLAEKQMVPALQGFGS